MTKMMEGEFSNEIPKPHTGIYSMHKYWSKKPSNIINRYIKKYTNPGDIVLEPFLGSGISSIESIFLNRKTIGIDINPMSIFITKQMLADNNISDIEKKFKDIEKILCKKIDKIYKVSINNKSFTATHFIYKDDILTEVWYKDNNVKKIINVTKTSNFKILNNFTYKDIKTFIPTKKMIRNPKINAKDSMSIYNLFTPRNMSVLSMIFNEINKIKDEAIRDFFKFCFTSCLGQASKMVFVISNRKKMQNKNISSNRKEVGSWVTGYWIPKEHFEINAWNCFKNRYNRNLKSKKEFKKYNPNIKYTENFKGLKNNKGTICLINDSCYKVLKKLPDNSIDYVITDPPHGNRIPYLELSMMWNDWLGFEANMKDELIVSDAKIRNKTITEYIKLLEKILVEINRVLKNNKYFTLMFNSYDNQLWKKLQQILFNLDLELSDIGTIGYSAPSVIQNSREGGLKTDFIFTFKKKELVKNKKQKIADEKRINQLISKYLAKNKDDDSMYKMVNYVIIHLIRNNLIFDMTTVVSLISQRFK